MTQKELIEYFVNNTQQVFCPEKFKLNRIAGGFRFIKKTDFGEEILTVGIGNYNPTYQLNFNISHINDKINELMLELDSKLNGKLKYQKDYVTWGTSYPSLNGLNRIYHLPKVKTYNDLDGNIKEIVNYTTQTLFPLSDKYCHYNELHKTINLDSFWETDWRMQFGLGLYFEYKRLLIAYLAHCSESEFQEIVQKQTEILEAKVKGEYGAEWEEAIEVQRVIVQLVKEKLALT